jgi:hypothetical protein
MTSFEIADCPTKLPLAEQDKAGKKVQTAVLTLTVRNATDRQRTGRVKVEPDQGAKPEWFALQGAAATNPRELEQDFTARGTESLRVTVTVPAGEAAKSCLFRVLAMEESDPGNDFVRGPNVAFDVKAWSTPAPAAKKGIPWWVFVAAGVVLLLVVGGIVGVLMMSSSSPPQVNNPQPVDVVGLTTDAAKKKLTDAGFAAANIQVADDSRTSGHTRGTVARATYPDPTHADLFLDPGAAAPPPPPPPSGLVDITKAQGEWRNVDANTRGVTRFVLAGNPMTLHAWGACHPTDCDWGAVPTSPFHESVSGGQVGALRALFRTSFDEVTVIVTPVPGEMLHAQFLTHFTDRSGRADTSENYQFRR